MGVHLHISSVLGVKVTRKSLRDAGVDPEADESTYPYVAVSAAPDPHNGPDFYLWARDSRQFIASSDGDERNGDTGVHYVRKLKGSPADEERHRSALTGFLRAHGMRVKDPEWMIIREMG